MADNASTMPSAAAETANSVTSPDRPAFRRALRLFSEAVRADWRAREGHAGPDAAAAWASCRAALHAVRDMCDADADLRAAAGILVGAEHGDLAERGDAVLRLARRHRKSRSTLAASLTEAACLLAARRGTEVLAGLRRTA